MYLQLRAVLRAALLAALVAAVSVCSAAEVQGADPLTPQVYNPLALGAGYAPVPPAAIPTDWLGRVNYYRAMAGLGPVSEGAALSGNCYEHARYMAENNELTHNQNPGKPFASAAGQICASKGNAWIGYGTSFTPADAVDGWMSSVGHRLWMIYPTTPVFGFGFYTAATRQAAAMDVLSSANFGADTAYQGWPVRYPAAGQTGIPARAYPVTLLWRYFGSTPLVSSTSMRVVGGAPIAHTASTSLPAGHKGVELLPDSALPPGAEIEVSVSGSYGGAPFTSTWRFTTDDASSGAQAKALAETETGEAPLP